MANHKLTVTVLSPLHIGSGEEFRLGFDFIVSGGRTYRLNIDTVLEKYSNKLVQNRGRYPLPGDLLSDQDFKNSEFFRYIISGVPRSHKGDARLKACIKDVYDRAYIPGSSLKGAIRTALAWNGWKEIKPALHLGNIGNSRKRAAQPLEKRIFGKDPNHDLLRALQVSDCMGVKQPGGGISVVNAQVVTHAKAGSPIELECIKPGLALTGSLRIDETLFQPQYENKLGFASRKLWLDELMPRIQAHSLERIGVLHAWFAENADSVKITSFYQGLINSKLSRYQALVQLGWGAGWDSKTFGSHLQADENFFEKLVHEFKLNKGRREIGDGFPASKRVVMSREDSNPIRPFGWVLLELEPKS